MKIQLAAIADGASISQDGTLSLMGIFSTIFAASVPVTHPQMYFAMILASEEEDKGKSLHIVVTCLDPTDSPFFGFESDVVVEEATSAGTTKPQAIQIQLTQFTRFGDYKFVVSINGRVEAVVPLHVEQLPAQGT